MMEYETAAADLPTAPIDGYTLEVVKVVSCDYWVIEDWERFIEACLHCYDSLGHVDPNWVRGALTNAHGLTIEPHRYSSFWARARSSKGFLDFIPGPEGWTINRDTAGRNQGKPIRLRQLRPAPRSPA